MVEFQTFTLPGLILITPRRHGDARGWFSEVWRRDEWAEAGIATDFIQDNQSYSAEVGTIRGLHFQAPPHAQAKLVRVLSGRLLDVAVDLRRSSPTFGTSAAVELDAERGQQLFIPAGFAHGFCTLAAHTTIAYKVDAYYSPQHDMGLLWNDPALAIAWPVEEADAVVSDKDRHHPPLSALQSPFA